jgi:hypothetical protein
MIELAGARQTDSVTLIGCEQIELVLELATRGFLDVTCRRPTGGPAGEKSADIIVAPGIGSQQELTEMLPRLSRALRPDGALLIGTADRLPSPFNHRTYEFLAEHGFAIARAARPDGLTVLCCRKYPMSQAQAA